MTRLHLPLNALRAFESAAPPELHARGRRTERHAGRSEPVGARAGGALEGGAFHRLPRSLALTDEGQALLPMLGDSFGRIEAVLEQFDNGHFFEVLSVGVVGLNLGFCLQQAGLFYFAACSRAVFALQAGCSACSSKEKINKEKSAAASKK